MTVHRPTELQVPTGRHGSRSTALIGKAYDTHKPYFNPYLSWFQGGAYYVSLALLLICKERRIEVRTRISPSFLGLWELFYTMEES